MAGNAIYLKFTDYRGGNPIKGGVTQSGFQGSLQVNSLTWSVEQTLNIGSQSAGAGAGKVAFNDLHFVKNVDANTPVFFEALCAGTPFQFVDISFVANGSTVATCRLKLAAVKSIDGTAGTDFPVEDIALEYGGAIWTVGSTTQGWNRVKNVLDVTPAVSIS